MNRYYHSLFVKVNYQYEKVEMGLLSVHNCCHRPKLQSFGKLLLILLFKVTTPSTPTSLPRGPFPKRFPDPRRYLLILSMFTSPRPYESFPTPDHLPVHSVPVVLRRGLSDGTPRDLSVYVGPDSGWDTDEQKGSCTSFNELTRHGVKEVEILPVSQNDEWRIRTTFPSPR